MSRFLESVIFEQPAAHVSIAGTRLETLGCDGSPTMGTAISALCQSRSRVEPCGSETRMVIWRHITDMSATVIS